MFLQNIIIMNNTKNLQRSLIFIKSAHRALYHHKVSSLYPPVSVEVKNPKDNINNSDNILKMINNSGIISSVSPGLFCILPLGLRSLKKLEKLIDSYMDEIGAQKISMPFLTPSSLWKASGRYESLSEEIGKFKDRHDHEYILSPTHEEVVTDLVSKTHLLPMDQMPLRLYQISTKFRDEMRLKHGLIRGREFIMKDLYTFDKSVEDAHFTYKEVLRIYDKIFSSLNLDAIKVEASVGLIGGSVSHEYHIRLESGEDRLLKCNQCNLLINYELIDSENNRNCQKCGTKMEEIRGLEIAHAFMLGTKYSKPLSAIFTNPVGKAEALQMGCYGIGLSRLVAGALEHLSSSALKWPEKIVPFKVCIIPPKKGSKEDKNTYLCSFLESTINELPGYIDDVVVDDRVKLSIGKRLNYARFMGFPIIIVIGKESGSDIPIFEVHDIVRNEIKMCTHLEIINYLTEKG